MTKIMTIIIIIIAIIIILIMIMMIINNLPEAVSLHQAIAGKDMADERTQTRRMITYCHDDDDEQW